MLQIADDVSRHSLQNLDTFLSQLLYVAYNLVFTHNKNFQIISHSSFSLTVIIFIVLVHPN